MLCKKLVTLVSAAGILASGACFLPPLHDSHPPAPPIQLDLQGIQNVEVQVTDKSDGQYLVASDLADRIAFNINAQAWRAHMAAHAAPYLEKDAVLQVTIFAERATPELSQADGRSSMWDFDLEVTAVLAKTTGERVWQEPPRSYHFRRKTEPESAAEVWKDPVVTRALTLATGNVLVYHLLQGQ